MIMASSTAMAQEGVATTTKKTFSRTTAVSIAISADKSTVWSLLTNAADFSRWNSTVVSIEGEIEKGGKIKLKSTLDPKRTFKLKVKAFEPDQRLVWGDALGEREYSLTQQGNTTHFSMVEKIGGPIFPLFASKIPSFDASFEQFAADLKKEAEAIQQAK